MGNHKKKKTKMNETSRDRLRDFEPEKETDVLLNTSASSKKLSHIVNNNIDQNQRITQDNSNSLQSLEGNFIVSATFLQQLVDSTNCCESSTVKLWELPESRCGWNSKVATTCSSCGSMNTFFTSARKERLHPINAQCVAGFRAIGKGQAAATKFSALLNLPAPVTTKPFASYSKDLMDITRQMVESEFINAADELRQLKHVADSKEPLDTGVTVDGSWLHRGHNSQHGFVTAILVETGKIIDKHYMCGYCHECARYNDSDHSSISYLEWYTDHEETCPLNHEGSPQSMEVQGVRVIFGQSLSKHNFRYNPFISDGDSKVYHSVCMDQPYGPDYYIIKEECVGHIQKRMGSRLRKLVKDKKGSKLEDGKGLQGKGRLTNQRMDNFQTYYGKAIRNNKGDLDSMQRATQAILYHSSDLPVEERHKFCPDGPDSWCKHKQGEEDSKGLPAAIHSALKPTFDFLSSDQILEGCLNGHTQNANESLHHLVWSIIPKEQYHSANEVELGINLGILIFNRGVFKTFSELFSQLGIELSQKSLSALFQIDQRRIARAELESSEEFKVKRKTFRGKKRHLQDVQEFQEGPMYSSADFYDTETKTKKARKMPSCKHCGLPRKGHSKTKCVTLSSNHDSEKENTS